MKQQENSLDMQIEKKGQKLTQIPGRISPHCWLVEVLAVINPQLGRNIELPAVLSFSLSSLTFNSTYPFIHFSVNNDSVPTVYQGVLRAGDAMENTRSFLQGAYHPQVCPRVEGSSPYMPFQQEVSFPSIPTPKCLLVFLGRLMGLNHFGNRVNLHIPVYLTLELDQFRIQEAGFQLFLSLILYVMFGKKILFIQEED